MASSSSASIDKWSYDVFLSFRGEDTRNNFVSHLYKALCEKGIFTFRDDKKLGKGKSIAPELRQAIKLSRFSIIILSDDYASSSWCLDELLEILNCMDTEGQQVVPIFYNVNPSDVRKQRGTYEKAFEKHEESFQNEFNKVKSWREAIKRVAELSGWDSRERDESLLIEEIIKFILTKLEFTYPAWDAGLVGMSSRIRNVISLLCMSEKTDETHNGFELDGVRIVGIWGMGGIGKTTIARATFDRIAKGFDACCFLTDVREVSKKYTINYLQKQLLSRTLKLQHQDMDTIDIGINFITSRLSRLRVLLVLDDVDTIEQLESLAGGHDWFGKRSRILITSRRRDILRGIADEIYEAEGLPGNFSMELLCRHAFKQISPYETYMEMSEWIVDYTKGNPLALKVLGSFLYKRSETSWQSALEKLKRMPHDKIYNILRISFDDLDSEEKDVFLDIACFFWGMKWNYAVEVLDSCGFSTEINLGVLSDRCLVSMQFEELWMHDLIKQMGHEIVRRKSPKELGKRSRLMYYDDIKFVLETNTGTKKIEGLALESPDTQLISANFRAFLKMHGLRFLIFKNISFDGVSGGLETLPRSLKYMHWQGYPYQHLPLQYNLENLVILNMPESGVKLLWEGSKRPINLKVLNLKFSKKLICIPDLSAATNLEVLLLTGCTSLLEVHQSVGFLKKLRIIYMEGCTNLQSLPDSIHLESLQSLILSGCKKLRTFPKISGKMNSMIDIALDGTAVEELPSSVDNLTRLESLNMEGCWMLKHLPNSICNLKYLKTFIVTNCSMLKELPENLDKLESLETLEADRSALTKFPVPVTHLERVEKISLDGCKAMAPWSLKLPSFPCLQHLRYLNLSNCNLVEVTGSIGQLSSLRILNLSRNDFVSISESIGQLAYLEHLDLAHCNNIKSVQVPWSLRRLNADSCSSLEAIEHSSSLLKRSEHSSRKYHGNETSEVGLEYQIFLLTNCSKLDERRWMDLMETILLNYHAMAAKWRRNNQFFRRDHIGIWFPGNEIPKWLSHFANGSSISLSLPSNNLFNYYQGAMVLCVVMSFPVEINPKVVKLVYKCSLGGKQLDPINVQWVYNGESPSIGSDHVVLIYIPSNWIPYYEHISQNLLLSVDFQLFVDDITVKMEKCGISLIDTKRDGENVEATIYRNHLICSNNEAGSSDVNDISAKMRDTKHELMRDKIQATISCKTPVWSENEAVPKGILKKVGSSNANDFIAKTIDTKHERDNTQASISCNTPVWSKNEAVPRGILKKVGPSKANDFIAKTIDTKHKQDCIQASTFCNTPVWSENEAVPMGISKKEGSSNVNDIIAKTIDTKHERDEIQAAISCGTPVWSKNEAVPMAILKKVGSSNANDFIAKTIDTKHEQDNIQAVISSNTPVWSKNEAIPRGILKKVGSSDILNNRKPKRFRKLKAYFYGTRTRCSRFSCFL